MTIENETHRPMSAISYPWKPAPLIYISLFLHLVVLTLLSTSMISWKWAFAIIIANHLVISLSVLFPKGQLLGPNETHLPEYAKSRNEIAITFDDGPDPEITPQILDILDQYHAKASFFCIGEKVAKFPEVAKEIVRRGHTIENHSYHHPLNFSLFGLSKLHKEVNEAQLVIFETTGQLPRYFRAPAGFRNPMLDPILAKNGLHYMSWTRRALDGVKCNAESALERLLKNFSAGDILLLHDGTNARTQDNKSVAIAILPTLLAEAKARNFKVVSLKEAFQK